MEKTILKDILLKYPDVWKQPSKFRALLMDLMPEAKTQRNLLLICVAEQIPDYLEGKKEVQHFEIVRLEKILIEASGCEKVLAKEIVLMWLTAFDINISTRESSSEENGQTVQMKQEKEQTNKSNRKKIMLLGGAILVVVVSILIYRQFYNNIIIPNDLYKQALSLVEESKYDEALKIIKQLDEREYSDKKINEINEKILASKYEKADEYVEQKKFEDAIEIFTELDSYMDSKERIIDTKYLYAKEQLEIGEYDKAISAFNEVIDYSDSSELLEKAEEKKETLETKKISESKQTIISSDDSEENKRTYLREVDRDDSTYYKQFLIIGGENVVELDLVLYSKTSTFEGGRITGRYPFYYYDKIYDENEDCYYVSDNNRKYRITLNKDLANVECIEGEDKDNLCGVYIVSE